MPLQSVRRTASSLYAHKKPPAEERAYYLSGRLPDQSIVVMDEKGWYYHVEKGQGKRYVACNRPSDRSEDFDEAA